MPTFESLEEKTVVVLRGICRDLNIPGMSKKRKDVIIEAILDHQVDEDNEGSSSIENSGYDNNVETSNDNVTGIFGGFQSNVTDPSKPAGERVTTIVRVSSGASSGDFGVAGKSVGAVGEFLKEVLNISSVSKGIVNGKEVEDDYVLNGGDTLEFIRPAGTKGWFTILLNDLKNIWFQK
jgi:hypothetical protein